MFDGYQKADEVNLKINQLLQEHPIDQETAKEWMRLTRTIGTTLRLLNGEIEHQTGISPENQ